MISIITNRTVKMGLAAGLMSLALGGINTAVAQDAPQAKSLDELLQMVRQSKVS